MLAILKALSDGSRLKIIVALTRFEEICACQITEYCQVSGATASRHLSILASAGLVESRKEGRWVYYRLHRQQNSFQWILAGLSNHFANDARMNAELKNLQAIMNCDPEVLCRKQRGEQCCPMLSSDN